MTVYTYNIPHIVQEELAGMTLSRPIIAGVTNTTDRYDLWGFPGEGEGEGEGEGRGRREGEGEGGEGEGSEREGEGGREGEGEGEREGEGEGREREDLTSSRLVADLFRTGFTCKDCSESRETDWEREREERERERERERVRLCFSPYVNEKLIPFSQCKHWFKLLTYSSVLYHYLKMKAVCPWR